MGNLKIQDGGLPPCWTFYLQLYLSLNGVIARVDQHDFDLTITNGENYRKNAIVCEAGE